MGHFTATDSDVEGGSIVSAEATVESEVFSLNLRNATRLASAALYLIHNPTLQPLANQSTYTPQLLTYKLTKIPSPKSHIPSPKSQSITMWRLSAPPHPRKLFDLVRMRLVLELAFARGCEASHLINSLRTNK